MSNKSNHKQDEQNRSVGGRRKVRWPRIFGLLLVLAVLVGAVALCIHLFGSVDMSSSDISEVSGDTTANAVSNLTSTMSTTTTKATTSKNTTSTLVDGHYIQPAGTQWNLKLVNPWNPIAKNYDKSLVTYSGNNQFDSRAIDNLRSLVKAGSPYNIRIASLYRTEEHQARLFENQVKKVMQQGKSRAEAEKIAATSVATPNTGEHRLGLAADFLFEDYSNLSQSYENTEAYKWMKKNCADFGFILRYPKEKQSITGVIYEPWHYRYVGVEAARLIMSRGITLEEYLQELGK